MLAVKLDELTGGVGDLQDGLGVMRAATLAPFAAVAAVRFGDEFFELAEEGARRDFGRAHILLDVLVAKIVKVAAALS